MEEDIQFIPIDDIHFEVSDLQSLSQSRNWGLDVCNIDDAWKVTQGAGIKVAVLDTGISEHEDLVGAWNSNEAFNCSSDQDFIDRHSGHGTHCSGIIGARDNDIGVVGVAPQCVIIPIKVLNDTGGGNYDNIYNGIKKAIEFDVDIISMSLGCPKEPPQSVKDIIQEATDKGIIVLAAAGNDGKGVNYPAKYNNVIAVAAMDENRNPAKFTSRGDEIDTIGPGVDIYSTYLNNQYARMSGTSQACPFIAGLCALLLSYSRNHPDTKQINNYMDMLKYLDQVCDCNNVAENGTKWGFGAPKGFNVDWTV